MVVMEAPFQRARRPEQKDQRREYILATAGQLALNSGVARVSLGDIAAAVGLKQSTTGDTLASDRDPIV